ncbi:MAG TPA: ATP-dependent zinc metalloprotease FtsH [Steroidobacteraceae bacterium]|nr:ATP-dependent zinc metalloprotease FtsH [Steroidobacteraceae bacterium]
METRHQLSIWYFVFALVAMLALQSVLFNRHVETLAYSDFKTLLHAGRIKEVLISEEALTGTADLRGADALLPAEVAKSLPHDNLERYAFITARVPDNDLIADLQAAKVRFSGQVENRWLSTLLGWVAPALVFVLIWGLLMRRMGTGQLGGMLDVGKSKAKIFVQKETGVHFADVAGIDEAKQELMEVVDFLKNPERYRRLGGEIPKGVLIVGAPGTGKTLLAKAVAGEAGVPFLSISGSEFVEMFVGVGAARVRDLFDQAAKLAPCIIFIDELDALGKARGVSGLAGNDEREQTLNQLLVQLDGFDTRSGVIIMAATNRPEILDPALLRPGRFDRQIALDRPDINGREQILRVHARRLVLGGDVDLKAVAGKTAGLAGADLANIVNEAALHAARTNKPAVGMSDFDEAIDRAITGLERKSRVMTAKERETVAYHEAGHALVAESRASADKVAKVSIIPRGIGALGYTQQQPTEDRYLLKHGELLDRLDVLLGGRAAEQLVFQELSTGAQNDLQRATDMARQMVTRYGMSEALGPATFEPARPALYLPESLPAARPEYSERTAELIDAEIHSLLTAALDRVRATLSARRRELEALAQELLRHETVDRATLTAILAAPTAPAPAAQPTADAPRAEVSSPV